MVFFPLFANTVTTIQVEDASEVRARTVAGAGVIDAETDPKLTVKAAGRGGLDSLTLAYGARVVLTNIAGNSEPLVVGTDRVASDARGIDLVHQGSVGFEWQANKRSKLASNTQLSYGEATVGTLLVQPRWGGEERPQAPRPFPTNQRAKFTLLTIGSFTAYYTQVTPRLSIQPAFFYLTWGAPDFETRKRLNYLQNPGVSVDITYNTTPKDDIVLQFAPQVNIFTSTIDVANRKFVPLVDPLTGRNIDNIGVTRDAQRFESRDLPFVYQLFSEARYRHKFSPRVSVEASAGVNFTLQRRPNDANDPYNLNNGPATLNAQVYPIAEVLVNASFRGGRNGQGRLIAFSRVAPWLNNLIGEAQWRSENIGALSLTFGKDTFRGQVAGLVGIPFAGENRSFFELLGEAGYSRKLGDVSLNAGLRLGYQIAELNLGQAKNITLQPSAYVGFAWSPRAATL
jgi:hypothetical protein